MTIKKEKKMYALLDGYPEWFIHVKYFDLYKDNASIDLTFTGRNINGLPLYYMPEFVPYIIDNYKDRKNDFTVIDYTVTKDYIYLTYKYIDYLGINKVIKRLEITMFDGVPYFTNWFALESDYIVLSLIEWKKPFNHAEISFVTKS
jgi:hypothetical protein